MRIHWQKIITASLKNSSDGVCRSIQLCVCDWGGSSGTHCLKWVDSAGQLMIRTTRAQLRRVGTSSGSTTDYWPRDWNTNIRVKETSPRPLAVQRTTGPGTEKCALALFFLFFTLLIFVITNTNIRVKEASPRPPVIQQTPGLATEKCENLLAIKSDLTVVFNYCRFWSELVFSAGVEQKQFIHGDCWPWIAGHVKVVTFWVGRTPNNIFEFLMK